MVSTSNVEVDVDVRVKAHVIVKVKTDSSAFHIYLLPRRTSSLRVLPAAPPIA